LRLPLAFGCSVNATVYVFQSQLVLFHFNNTKRANNLHFFPADETGQSRQDESYSESYPNLSSVLLDNLSSACSLQGLQRRLPILKWLPTYNKTFFLEDCVAGLSVGLTAIPQGIAYAVVAGLPPQYGLYSSFMGECLIGV